MERKRYLLNLGFVGSVMHRSGGSVNVIHGVQWLGKEKMYFIWANDIRVKMLGKKFIIQNIKGIQNERF